MIINLKEMYSNYYIRQWKREGLPLITERPPTTTQELFDKFFESKSNRRFKKEHQQRFAIKQERRNKAIKKLDWRDYLKEEYRW